MTVVTLATSKKHPSQPVAQPTQSALLVRLLRDTYPALPGIRSTTDHAVVEPHSETPIKPRYNHD